MARSNAKYECMRVELDSIVGASFKNQSKVCIMIHSLVRVSSNIIDVSFDYVFEIMKSESHGSLEGCYSIFQAEWHFLVYKCAPRTYECHLMLVFGFDLDLVIA
jgi:hypothetical protein